MQKGGIGLKNNRFYLIWGMFIVLVVGGYLTFENRDSLFGQKNISKETASAETVENEDNFVASTDINNPLLIENISKEMEGTVVTVKATIDESNLHKNGHVFLQVKDDSGKIEIPIFSDKNIPSNQLIKGQEYLFTGQVDLYEGRLEIIPRNANDVKKVEYDNSDITLQNEGKFTETQGEIISKYDHPEGHTFLTMQIEGINSDVEVPLFNTMKYDSSKLVVGSVISVKGEITNYKEKLQIIPKSTSDVELIETGQDSNISFKKINEISELDRGKLIQVRGTITDLVEKDGHVYFILNDQEHKIKSVLFKADGNEIYERKLKIMDAAEENYEIRVLGLVDIYKEELELIIDKIYIEN